MTLRTVMIVVADNALGLLQLTSQFCLPHTHSLEMENMAQYKEGLDINENLTK